MTGDHVEGASGRGLRRCKHKSCKSNGNLAENGTLYWYMTPGVVAETDLAGTTKSEYIFFDGERVARHDTGAGGVFYLLRPSEDRVDHHRVYQCHIFTSL